MKTLSALIAALLVTGCAASSPVAVTREEVPADMVDREREIYKAQALESGKPENIVDNMVKGRMNKFFVEHALVDQPFVKDPDLSVDKLLGQHGASVRRYADAFEVSYPVYFDAHQATRSAYSLIGTPTIILLDALTPLPEAGAQCVSSARWDLCGGWAERPIPTATFRRSG